MKILTWNMNGLSRKIQDQDFIHEINNYDIIILTETWLSKNTCVNLEIPKYNCKHLFGNKSRDTQKGRYSGGISLYYKRYN